MMCATCAAIPESIVANIGRDQSFPAHVRALKPLRLQRDLDLWVCPGCSALFQWTDDSSWTGWGNDDAEILTRLDAEQSRIMRTCLGGVADAELFALTPELLDLALTHLTGRDRAIAQRLVPALVAELARTDAGWLSDRLIGLAYGHPDDAAAIVAAIEAIEQPTQRLVSVATRCRAIAGR